MGCRSSRRRRARAVHGGVQIAQFGDARVGLVEVVEAVVYLGHPLVVVHHERDAVLVVRLFGGIKGGIGPNNLEVRP